MASLGLARRLLLLVLLLFACSAAWAVDQCPSACSCLGSHVDCSRRGLSGVPTDLPSWTETLYVSIIIKSRVMDEPHCRELQGNRLENVSADAFIRLSHLQKL